VVLLTLWACSGTADVATAPSVMDGSWLGIIAKDPKQFEQTISDSREGWIALHKNDWLTAVSAPGAPGRRAAAELSVFHALLAGTSNEAWRALGTTWERRGNLPTNSVIPRLVALAAKDAGDTTAQMRWEKLPSRADVALDARVALHQDVRKGTGAPTALLSVAGQPMLEEPVSADPSEGSRALWDPLLHHTLAQFWARGVAAEGYPSAMAGALFTGGIDPADGSPAATLAKLGLHAPVTDDVDACREAIRTLDRELDAWKSNPAHGDDARALFADLRLVEGLRARALVDWGVDALGADHPRCALAMAEMALDHESPRAITPINSPTLFAVMAQANLRTGHTREALDALQVLVGAYPEVTGLDETVGDLAVLEGLDRTGDSREN
jgi:hypothetical protein